MNKPLITKKTLARLDMGHVGGHLKTSAWLKFQTDFLQAKDALNSEYDTNKVKSFCEQRGLTTLQFATQARTLQDFLLHPHLGKLLTVKSERKLTDIEGKQDVLIVISGGLSPIAIENHVLSFLSFFLPSLADNAWQCAPIILFPRSRVAIGDQINQLLKTKIVMVIIGERPGLSSPDSMGIYFTYHANACSNDSQRQCLSNIHGRGMSCELAAIESMLIIKTAFQLGYTGIQK